MWCVPFLVELLREGRYLSPARFSVPARWDLLPWSLPWECGPRWACVATSGILLRPRWTPREDFGARVDFIGFLWLVSASALAEKVQGLPYPCLLFGLAPYSAGGKARCSLW